MTKRHVAAAALLITGVATIMAAVLAGKLGLGIAENFFFHRHLGISRSAAAVTGCVLLLAGVIIVRLSFHIDGMFTRRFAGFTRHLDHIVPGLGKYCTRILRVCGLVILVASHKARLALAPDVPRGTWGRSALILVVQVLSLVAFWLVAFENNRPYLLHGLDGAYAMTIVKQQHLWTTTLPGFTSNFFQSLGNVWFPLNTRLIPGYALSLGLNGGKLDPVVSYVIFSVELFVGVWLLCMALRQHWLVATVAAWTIVISVMPYSAYPVIYGIYGLAPHLATTVAAASGFLLLFAYAGQKSLAHTSGCALGLIGVVFYLVAASPPSLILFAPYVAVCGLCLILAADSKRERNAKLGVAALVIAASFVLGLPQFLLGLYKYTAAWFFASEFFNDRQLFDFVSIAFQGNTFGIAGPILFGLGVSGGILAAIWGKGVARMIAIGMFSYLALLMATGTAAVYFDFWRGPSPLYFEFLLWPFYAIYSAVLLRVVAVFTMSVTRPQNAVQPSQAPTSRYQARSFVLAAGVACLPWLLFPATDVFSARRTRDFAYPPIETPIVRLLEKEAGLTPGSGFRGRIATFTGLGVPKEANWLNLHTIDLGLVKQFGNDHRMVGLWYYDIPTLFEYSPYLSPAFYLLTRTFLARPEDRQMRNVVTLRRVEPRLLRALGVRFLITDAPLPSNTRMRLRLRIPKQGEPKLYLYELDGVNVGDYSPTKHRVIGNARDTLAALARSDFDPRQEVLSDVPLPNRLVPASSSRLIAEPGQLYLSARSDARSVIVLPLEYSHCLEIHQKEPGTQVAQLFRANLAFTGVIFTGYLEATLRYFTGPLHNAGCRIDDANDMERLGVRAASRNEHQSIH